MGDLSVLLVGGAGVEPLPWAGQGVRVRRWSGDVRRLPFLLAREPFDVVIATRALPASLGPLGVPVMAAQALPRDPSTALHLLRRVAASGRVEACLSRGVVDVAPSPTWGPPIPFPHRPAPPAELLPDAGLEGLRQRLLPDIRRQVERVGRACAVLSKGWRALTGAPDPLSPLSGRRAAWRPAPVTRPHRPAGAPAAAPAGRQHGDSAAGAAAGAPAASEPVVLLLGPVDRLTEVEELVDAVSAWPDLTVRFRLFRAGVYRMDGEVRDLEALRLRLLERADVAGVVRDGQTLHVLPAAVGPP